jgi:hypothetical protein
MSACSKHNSAEEFWREVITKEVRRQAASEAQPADGRLAPSFGSRAGSFFPAPVVPRAGNYRCAVRSVLSVRRSDCVRAPRHALPHRWRGRGCVSADPPAVARLQRRPRAVYSQVRRSSIPLRPGGRVLPLSSAVWGAGAVGWAGGGLVVAGAQTSEDVAAAGPGPGTAYESSPAGDGQVLEGGGTPGGDRPPGE